MTQWQCPKCKREFAKTNQMHSCTPFPLEKHFENKETSKVLYTALEKALRKELPDLKIESLPCCIHFVSHYTFGATWAMKDKIRVDFRLDREIKNPKFFKTLQISKNRFMYYLDIRESKEIDEQLLNWMAESAKLHH